MRASEAEQPPIGFTISLRAREVVKGVLGDPNNMIANEGRTLARSVFRMLQGTLPLHDRPTGIVILRELAEDAAEIHLTIAQGAKTPGAVDPILVSAIDTRSTGRIELRVLHVEGTNTLM